MHMSDAEKEREKRCNVQESINEQITAEQVKELLPPQVVKRAYPRDSCTLRNHDDACHNTTACSGLSLTGDVNGNK